jgi:cardiolipin synthase A/B
MQVQWDQISSFHLLYSLGGLAILISVMHMLYRRRSPLSMTAWLLFMVIAPYFFVIFYFLFGIRKRSFDKEKSPLPLYPHHEKDVAVHPLDTLLRANGIPASTHDNSLHFYMDGVEAYEALFASLNGAKHSISISVYLLKNDVVTQGLFDLLIQKAHAGVDVRILIDAFGSAGLYLWQFPLKRLKDQGVAVSFFMPLLTLPLHSRLNLRYHRKIYLIDDTRLFSGGMNLAQEYMGPQPLKERWTDLLFSAEGSMVNNYRSIFESDWAYSQHIPIKQLHPQKRSKPGSCTTQVIPSGPDVSSDALLEAIIYAIHKAHKKIWIVTPYFVPDESIFQALHIALHRGVDVKLITPRESDHLIADLGRSSYIREAQDWGIDVALYGEPKLHAKAILFDDDAVILGSVNLDNRSLLLNYEVVTLIYSKTQIDEIAAWMADLLQNSTSQIDEAGRIRRIFENLMRIFVPQL